MKKTCVIIGAALLLVLLVYATLAYFVFFCYGPRIVEEESRQEGWLRAIAEVEKECRLIRENDRKSQDEWVRQTEKKKAESEKQKARLEKAVRDERARRSLLEQKFKGQHKLSDLEWKRKTDERLRQAQQALDSFEQKEMVGYKNDEANARLVELRRQLDALRARRQEFQDLCEMRDRLMVWPLPLIAPLFDDKKEQ